MARFHWARKMQNRNAEIRNLAPPDRVPIVKRPSGVVIKPAGLCMKPPYGAIMPKKGKARALTRQPQRRPKVPYVQRNEKPRKETKWRVNLKFFMKASDVQTIDKLKQYGWLRMHKQCPWRNANLTSSRLRGELSVSLSVSFLRLSNASPLGTLSPTPTKWSCFSRPSHASFNISWYHIGAYATCTFETTGTTKKYNPTVRRQAQALPLQGRQEGTGHDHLWHINR